MIRRPLSSPLFPYTTLFRSYGHVAYCTKRICRLDVTIVPDRNGNITLLSASLALFQFDRSLHRLLSNRSEEHTSELQSLTNLVCRLLLEKKKQHNRLFDRTH